MLTKGPFGVLADKTPVEAYTLENSRGASLTLLPFGARIHSLRMPDPAGVLEEMVMGHRDLSGYARPGDYQGAIVGRCANRIGGGRFLLDGKEFRVTQNAGNNALHGGIRGFSHKVWKVLHTDQTSVTFSCLSPNGEEGYPGNCEVTVRYTLTEENAVEMDYTAQTDAATCLNLTNHCYFHLGGAGRDVLSTVLQINADRMTETDEELIPTGRLLPVDGPWDFRSPKAIGQNIRAMEPSLQAANGYDLNYVLNGSGLRTAAVASDREAGRKLQVLTDLPGMQLYTANGFGPEDLERDGSPMQPHHAFCLETQYFPDSINHPEFPYSPLRPGSLWRSKTVFQFSVC